MSGSVSRANILAQRRVIYALPALAAGALPLAGSDAMVIDPAVISLLSVVFAAGAGGSTVGLVAAAIAAVMGALFPPDGMAFAVTAETLLRGALIGLTGTVIAAMIGALHRRRQVLGMVVRATEERLEREMAAHRVALDEALRLATHDPLTGVPNRRILQDRFHQAAARAQRDGTLIGVLMMDIDEFKSINDNYGHAAGDAMLCALAGRLLGTVRQEDTVSRVGGDEFAVMLVGLKDTDNLVDASRRMLDALKEGVQIAGQRQKLPLAVSIGVSVYPRDGEDLPDLLRHADQQMYRAKTAGIGMSLLNRGT